MALPRALVTKPPSFFCANLFFRVGIILLLRSHIGRPTSRFRPFFHYFIEFAWTQLHKRRVGGQERGKHFILDQLVYHVQGGLWTELGYLMFVMTTQNKKE